jgi:CheY-like chemotaxis protein
MTDILMPNMDGIDMMNQIRAFEKSTNQHIPIIAMTAFSMPEDRERCLNAGADIYVPKPLVKNDILQAIDKAIVLTGKNQPFVEPTTPLPTIT